MTFRIREARTAANLTQDQLAAKLGIKGATLSGYETGNHDPKSNTLIQIANICGVTVDYLLGIDRKTDSKPTHTKEALSVAVEYDKLDAHGKRAVRAIMDVESARIEEEQRSVKPRRMVSVRHFLESAAAGLPLWTEDGYEYLDYPADLVPDGTDFSVDVTGCSMEPDYPEGCTVFVHQTERVNDGDVVVAWLDGEGTVIKRALAPFGQVLRLESINRSYPDFDSKQLERMKIYGKVIGYME